jgi:hypothetical protein
LETIGPNAAGSRQSHWGDRPQGSRHARKPPEASGLAKHVTREVCHDIENKSSCRRSTSQGENANVAVSRQEALERYLAGDPMEVIYREMGCAKSWVYPWKNRSQVTEPDWLQEHSRRPETTATKTPDALEVQIVRLCHTLSPDGLGTVSAGMMRDHLRHHGAKSIPSRHMIYRIRKRQAQEVNSHTFTS